jgi:hypothetical protein
MLHKRQLADEVDVYSEKLLKPVSFDGLGLYFLKRSLLKTTECFYFAVQYSITREWYTNLLSHAMRATYSVQDLKSDMCN